ncbi:Helix-turn-helix [Mesorhizobium albiziae]|uniref:Helix-turn-helix n=1 Tax=Neomesorhizobium albiziae TaxID=335020 RepID=A0A1I4E8Z1_9HYPH|nr:helix-turn-helix domain-containing protein [Mesorhizobium albiziae]GLS33800.1 hypothetical protein GCM10007937_55130 [Mesorhizobium albiziae]SFL01753.1 Helix-turn-helix [Mesorhizobium albiziae]
MTPTEFRTIRDRLGLTQAELARVLGYHHPSHISSFERETGGARAVPTLLALDASL